MNMNIILAPDSYKGSLSSIQVGEAMKRGLRKALPHAQLHIVPMADGGEGTLEALLYQIKGEKRAITAKGPLGEKRRTTLAICKEKKIAIIESALIIGLPLLSREERNPLETTSYGLGEAILYCLDQGIREFIIGLGGSATNDGGIGLLEALGASFLQSGKIKKNLRAKDFQSIDHVDLSGIDPRVSNSQFLIASDVNNPLFGEQGASSVYGPQKGATPEMVTVLDQGLEHFAHLLNTEDNYQSQAGAGAAGGLGFAFLLLGGQLQPGAKIVSDYLSIENLLQDADLLITGEGKTDGQTMYGKAPFYLAQKAKKYGVPTIILSGTLGEDYQNLSSYVDGFFSIIQQPVSVEEAMELAEVWVEDTAFNIGCLLKLTQA
jgi:glycerate kinase